MKVFETVLVVWGLALALALMCMALRFVLSLTRDACAGAHLAGLVVTMLVVLALVMLAFLL